MDDPGVHHESDGRDGDQADMRGEHNRYDTGDDHDYCAAGQNQQLVKRRCSMAETPTDPTISAARELEGPLQRARDVARQHSASSPDGGTGPGHRTTFWEGVGTAR